MDYNTDCIQVPLVSELPFRRAEIGSVSFDSVRFFRAGGSCPHRLGLMGTLLGVVPDGVSSRVVFYPMGEYWMVVDGKHHGSLTSKPNLTVELDCLFHIYNEWAPKGWGQMACLKRLVFLGKKITAFYDMYDEIHSIIRRDKRLVSKVRRWEFPDKKYAIPSLYDAIYTGEHEATARDVWNKLEAQQRAGATVSL